MWSRLVFIAMVGGSAAAGMAAAQPPEGEPSSAPQGPDTSRRVPLETDVPAGVLERIAPPILLPTERDAEFYARTLGEVLARVAGDDSRPEFLRWLAGPGQVSPEPVSAADLWKDAAKLARIRLRTTADQRTSRSERFVALSDLRASPQAYEGRAFTVWGRVMAVRPLVPAEAQQVAVYEAGLEAISDSGRFRRSGELVWVVLAALPEGFPHGDRLNVNEAVTVTGYFFRADSADQWGPADAWWPLLVAPTLTWHRAELDPHVRAQLTATVRHRTPHRLEEVDDFYRLLRHAQLVSHKAQQQAARRFLAERIAEFPADSRADLEFRLRQIQDQHASSAPNAAELDRRIEQANRIYAYERQQYGSFRNDPEQFPTFAHLFRSVESSDPHRYTGRPVTLAGHIRKHVSYPADPQNAYGVTWLHEVWLYPDDGDSNPVVVVCASVPEGLPQGDKLLERAAVTGYFFKMWAYPARDTMRVAPMILAQRVEWHRRDVAAGESRWGWIGGLLAGSFAVMALVWIVWSHGRRGSRLAERYARTPDDEPPDFSRF